MDDPIALYLRLLGDRRSPATKGVLALKRTPRQQLADAIGRNLKART